MVFIQNAKLALFEELPINVLLLMNDVNPILIKWMSSLTLWVTYYSVPASSLVEAVFFVTILSKKQQLPSSHISLLQAFAGLKSWQEAKKDFQAVLAMNSGNKAAKNQLTIADHHAKKELEREKRMYAGMFGQKVGSLWSRQHWRLIWNA